MDPHIAELASSADSSSSKRRLWLPVSLRDYQRPWLATDIVAGLTLAAVAIPESMGYSKIAGMPVVTGLYTILLPVVAFALLGSSRRLVIGADSATAAILFAGLFGMAHPTSANWVMLASAAALMTAGLLLVASLLRLGFLANFLSRTVLVGFLSGVGVSLILGQLPDILRVTPSGNGPLLRFIGTIRSCPHAHTQTLLMSATVIAVIILLERFAKRIPGPLIAVALAIGATWLFHLDRFGLSVVGPVHAGLPPLSVPRVSPSVLMHMFPMTLSMFLVILAQSAATSRSFAQKYNEPLNENQDLMALFVANLLAGVSKTFVVNGSPTKTAVAESAGARTQVAQLVMAALTVIVLLFATSLIAKLPNAALASLVFLIGVRLVNVRALRDIWTFRKSTFAVAMAALAGVVLFGVEQGIFFAIALSILDHLQQEYRPKDGVLTPEGPHWIAVKAAPGIETAPGLIVYRFEAPLFFANADYFVERVKLITAAAPHPVQWLILDMVSMNDIDYTAGLTLLETVKQVQLQGVRVAVAQAEDVHLQMKCLGLMEMIGSNHVYASVVDAVTATGIYPSIVTEVSSSHRDATV